MPITDATTLGAEIEIPHVGAHAVDGMRSWLRFRIGDDGSLRDTTYRAGDLDVIPEFDKRGSPILAAGMRPQSRFGLEVITEPYMYSEFLHVARKTAWFLSSIPQNPRTSIHVHVDASGMAWWEMRRLLLWTHALEAPLFRIACGGQQHRGCREYKGDYNDHKFARPLSNPIGIQYSSGEIAELINWAAVRNAKSATEFMSAWGRLDTYWTTTGGFEHYMPHRLHMVNIASILRQGTVEWRLFDGLYNYFDRFIELVYRVHRLVDQGEPDFDFVLGSEPNIDSEWVSRLLDMDVGELWGDSWQEGCRRRHPLSHYPSQPTIHTLDRLGHRWISNGRELDHGDHGFVPYIRS